MNAEIFEKKEYADSVARVDFIRAKDLAKDQLFLMSGVWWIVHSIKDGRIYYYNSSERRFKSKSMGANNQMFVQIIKTPIKEV